MCALTAAIFWATGPSMMRMIKNTITTCSPHPTLSPACVYFSASQNMSPKSTAPDSLGFRAESFGLRVEFSCTSCTFKGASVWWRPLQRGLCMVEGASVWSVPLFFLFFIPLSSEPGTCQTVKTRF